MSGAGGESGRGRRELWRRGVGVVLFNERGLVLMGKRIDNAAEAWQFPQGGIDHGESAREAVAREAEEEIGTRNFRIVAESGGWLSYRLPPELQSRLWGGRFVGQKQRWYLARFLGHDGEIRLDAHGKPEFSRWGWFGLGEAEERIVPFKREMYRALVSEFAPLLRAELKQAAGGTGAADAADAP